MNWQAFATAAPELAASGQQRLHDQVAYLAAGVRLIWVADPATRTIYAYHSITEVHEYSGGQDLSGEDILPGFTLSVASLFAD